jgi:hypothetical protein
MKILVTESQYKKLLKEEKEQKVLHIPSLKIFDDNWDMLQKFLELKGNPAYSIGGYLDLSHTDIQSLGNLTSVGGDLDLEGTPIKSLGNLTSVGGVLNLYDRPIRSLGNLKSVGGDLDLRGTPIESLGNLISVGGSLDLYGIAIESLGNLQSVGGYLDLIRTPLSKTYTEKQIREMVNVGGNIYL